MDSCFVRMRDVLATPSWCYGVFILLSEFFFFFFFIFMIILFGITGSALINDIRDGGSKMLYIQSPIFAQRVMLLKIRGRGNS